jgi:hypothetical protein
MSQPSRSGTSRAESETKPRARTEKLLVRRQYALTDKDGSHDKDTGDLLFLEVVRWLRRAGRLAVLHALARVCACVCAPQAHQLGDPLYYDDDAEEEERDLLEMAEARRVDEQYDVAA